MAGVLASTVHSPSLVSSSSSASSSLCASSPSFLSGNSPSLWPYVALSARSASPSPSSSRAAAAADNPRPRRSAASSAAKSQKYYFTTESEEPSSSSPLPADSVPLLAGAAAALGFGFVVYKYLSKNGWSLGMPRMNTGMEVGGAGAGSDKKFRRESIAKLNEFSRDLRTFREVDLSGHAFGDEGFVYLAEGLAFNQYLWWRAMAAARFCVSRLRTGAGPAMSRVLTSAVDLIDSDEELLDDQDRITGTLQIGVVGCRRSASWICFGGGSRPRRKRAWKTVNRKGSFAKARKLVDVISELPSDKEEIYGALDAFVAWELEFPIIAIKKALQFMAEVQQWKRVIQVTKWMLSKGQGKTMGTYTLLLQAFDYEGRVEEADALWEKLLTQQEDTTPRIMFTVIIAMFERHNQPRRLLQVFADMEELEIKPDIVTVERVVRTYRSLGLLKRAADVESKYPPTKWGFRYSKRGKKYRIRVTAEGEVINPESSITSEAEAKVESEEYVDDSDSDDGDDEFVYIEESEGEESYFLKSDTVVSSIGLQP